jgi:ABC-type amino acid transport substrate-binding protein
MTDEEWETALKSMNDDVRKWVNEEIDKIKYNVVKDIINRELKND